jgi:hypothetical protein
MADKTSTEILFSDIDPKTLPQDLQPFYKMMQGQFTKKMQELSGQTKEYETMKGQIQTVAEERDTLKDQVGKLGDAVTKLKSVNEEWDAWYVKNYDPATGKARSAGQDGGQRRGFEFEGEDGNADDNSFLADKKRNNGESAVVKSLKAELDELKKTMLSETGQLKKSYNFFLQLDQLKKKYGADNVNEQLVVQTALEKGHENLEDAYTISHLDKIIETKSKTLADDLVKQELEKQKAANVLTGEGKSYPLIYERKTETPRNYDEARNLANQDIGLPPQNQP